MRKVRASKVEELTPDAKLLVERMRTLGMSRRQFAEQIGYSDRQIYNYEYGKKPVPKVLKLLLWALQHEEKCISVYNQDCAYCGYSIIRGREV